MITKDKVTEIFCIADDFYQEYEFEIKKHLIDASESGGTPMKRNRKGKLSHNVIST